jgi:acyl-CoA synthetase (AMP-forming)/AMP-acid ligase II
VIELLRRVARDDPERAAVVVDDGIVSYGELLARAEAVAGFLVPRSIRRFAVLDHDAATVIALLAGASLAGAEACQYPPTDDLGAVADLLVRFDHDVLVTARTDVIGPQLVAPADLIRAPHIEGAPPTARPLLVLTTGTTGPSRGVRHDWSRLLRSTRRIAPAPGQRWLLAYGLHQFAGLQVLLHVFAAGATLVAPAPRRPREGLAAMRRHGADHVSATPTYWRFLLAELHADAGEIPRIAQITLGGEAVPAPLVAQLRATFPHARISQVYAASEFGSTGSVRDDRNGLSTEVLSRPSDADVAMKVVDGELWVRSRTGMLGYYGEPSVDPDAWRPTGDLVEIVGDRIFFRGRRSDIINVGGVKVHPLPIEERVAAVAGVQMARVYARPNPMTGAIVAVDVVVAPGADVDAVKAAVRESCADLAPAARPRSVKCVDAVAMTDHKIVRSVAR